MKTIFQRFGSGGALVSALIAATVAHATPTISFTPGQFPATGSPVALATSPTGLNISVNAAPTAGSSISSVTVSANGTFVGTATGSSPFVVNWQPAAAGTFTIAATVNDTSTITTGASASTNTATINSIVTINAVHTATVTVPVANSIIAQNSQIVLRGTAFMSDGLIGNVEFFLRDSLAVEYSLGSQVTSAPYFLPVTITAVPGSYNLFARATPNGGGLPWDSAASYPINIVSQVGTGPSVSIVSPQVSDVIAVGNTVAVTATASDSDGFIPNSAPGGVSFYADGELIATDLTAPYSVNWTPTIAKTVTLIAVTNDDKGNYRSSSRNVTVLAAAPTVSVSAPANNSSATVGVAVTVNATATPGVGTTITNVQFLADGGAIGAPDTTSPYGVSWTPAASGSVALTARVTDSNGTIVTSAPINVNVASAPGALAVTLTAPTNGTLVPLGTTASFTATATAAAGATVSKVEFLVNGTVVGTSLSAPYSASWTPTTTGIFAVTARVTDSFAATATSLIANVSVTGPSVALTSPTAGTAVVLGSPVALSATASATGPATVTKVDFFAGATLVGTAFSAPYTVNWTPTATGSVSLTARVTDSNNAAITSTAVAVTVATSVPTVAITTPTNGASIPLGTSATVTASASASGGAVVSRVDFLSGTTVIGTVLSAPYSISWTPTATGITALTARVTDSNGTAVTSTIINVNVNGPTVALTSPSAGSAVILGIPVALNATASAVGPATVTKVDFFAGAALVGTSLSAPYTVNWTPTATGTVSLTARVTDSNNAVVTSTANSVTVATSVPTVAITTPTNGASIPLGTSATVTASASASGGAVVSRVDFLSGTTVIGTVLSAPYTISWTPTATGITALTARVTDSNGTAVTSTIINVNVTGPTVALTSPTAGTAVVLGSPVALSATASATGPATVTKVDFFAGATLVGTAFSAPYTVNWTPTATGSVSLTARVTDSNNAAITSTAVAVTVATSVPTVAITTPTNGALIPLGASATVTASASASGGAVVNRVDFLAGTTVIGTVLSAPYSISWTPTAAGITALTVRVTDSNGTAVTSTIINVNVTGPTVALTSPSAGSPVILGIPVALTATASAVGPATVTKVDFFSGVTLVGTAFSAPYTVNWTPTATGSVSLTARVTDSNNAVVTSTTVSVTITATPIVPPTVTLVSPSAGETVPVNLATMLSVSAAASPGNTVTRVDYFLNGGSNIGTSITGSLYSVAWTPTVSGIASLTARVTDSTGATATSSPVLVTVAPSASGSLSATLTLTGSTAIPGGSTRAVTVTGAGGTGVYAYAELYYDATLVGTDTTAPYNFLFTAPNTGGNHFLSARIVDSNGLSATSVSLPIFLTSAVGISPLVAIVTPASGSFVGVGAATTITGTASDADGSVSTVQVFVNGSSIGNATLSGASWSIAWTPTVTGVASLSAIATDNSGNSVAAPAVGVNVTDSSSPAITLAFTPGTIFNGVATLPSGATRNIVATVTPATGRAVVRVEFFIDGTKIGEDTTFPYTTRYIAPPLGAGESSHTYVLSARATDNAGAARDVLQSLLIVAPLGQPPTVNLITPTSNTAVVPNVGVSLAASALAPGGTITSVQFYVNGNPALVNNGNPILTAPYTATFVPTTAGAYTIDAIATDDRGNTAVSRSATVTAAFATPTVVLTSPNPNVTARATPNVPLNLAATATVQSGTGAAVLLVEFLLDGVQIGADTTAPYTFSWTPLAAQIGQHVITARVTDTNSQTATSAPVNVTVANLVGTPPTVTISTNPIPAQGIQTVSQVNFIANAAASAVGASITTVEFFLNDVSIGTASREQATNLYRISYDFSRFDFSTAPAVTDPNSGVTRYTPIPLYAIVRDSNGNQAVSTTANLTINPSTSSPPSIQLQTFGQNQTITQGQQFFMGATASDPDGTVAVLQLYANGVLNTQVGNPQQNAALIFTPNAPGRFNLFAVAIDDTGNSVISSPAIVVNVTAVNAPATNITQPSNDSTVTSVNAQVFLEATAVNTDSTQIPFVQFITTASSGARSNPITATRVGQTNTFRAIWTPTTADTYTVTSQATVGVATGTSSASRRVVVNNLVGLAPAISINVPGSTTTVSTVNFTATATDSDGSVIEVEFFLNRNSVGKAVRDQLANTWRFNASFIGVPPGNAEVVALVRDNDGNVAASGTSNVNVVAASSIAPSISISPSTTTAAFNRQLQITANARDSDGSIANVQYFANSTALNSSSNANTNYQINWTPTTSGTFSLYAIATDNTNNTTISPSVTVTVSRNNPIQENTAFILQTYQDIANTTNINPIVFSDLDAQLTAGTLTRADLVTTLVDETGFTQAVNMLAAYYVLMGQWPTPSNYASLLTTARNQGLAATVGAANQGQGTILGSNEYFAKFSVVPTTQLLDNPASLIPAETFLNRLYLAAGLGSPSALNRVQFRSNNVLNATTGRGYAVIGLQTSLAEFITNTNSTNDALLDQARAAALYYQLDRPPVTVTSDQIAMRVAALTQIGTAAVRNFAGTAADRLVAFARPVADATLKDILYGYRYVTITKNPQSYTVSPRSGVLFSVEAQGAPPLSYQWLLNGAPIANATNAILSLANVNTTSVGTYTVSITSSVATATSDPATLTLSNTPTRLANISTRGPTTGAGANLLIGGFVVQGANATQTRQMLIRVVGPTLGAAPFNVPGVLANPRLEVYAGNNQTPVLINDDWGTQTGGAAQVTAIQQAIQRAGAFAFIGPNSNDAAVLATLPPGNYTIQAKAPLNNLGATGVVLIEVYDVTPGGAAGPKAANVSTRGSVGTGANVLIAGFVINGANSRRMLIRGAGPTLTGFGVPGVLADPQLSLADQVTGTVIRTNDDWASGADAGIIAQAAIAAGAFPFANGGKDAAMIVMLAPGAYTVTLSGVNSGTGVGLVEVYDVDP